MKHVCIYLYHCREQRVYFSFSYICILFIIEHLYIVYMFVVIPNQTSNISSFIHSFVHLNFHSFIHSYFHSFVPLFEHSFIHLFVQKFIQKFIYSRIHSFVCSFYSFKTVHTHISSCICHRRHVFMYECNCELFY